MRAPAPARPLPRWPGWAAPAARWAAASRGPGPRWARAPGWARPAVHWAAASRGPGPARAQAPGWRRRRRARWAPARSLRRRTCWRCPRARRPARPRTRPAARRRPAGPCGCPARGTRRPRRRGTCTQAFVRPAPGRHGGGGVPGHFRGPLGAPLEVDQVLALGAPAAPVAGHLLDDRERLLQQHAAIRLRVEELRQVRIQRLLSAPRRASSAPPLQLPHCARTSAQRALAALRMRCSDPGSIDRKSGTRRRALPWPSSARPYVPDRPHTAQSEQFKSAPPCCAACYAPVLCVCARR